MIALTGTGLGLSRLGLLAYDIAGADAAAMLGTALAIKMVAYVGIGPLAGALAAVVPRKALLVTLDVVRAGIAACLPWVDQVWQVYLPMFLLQASSAMFTPTFQATILDVLADERDYTRALILSRLAYDLESLLSRCWPRWRCLWSPTTWCSRVPRSGSPRPRLLVVAAVLPGTRAKPANRGLRATTQGLRIYLATPRLRGLFAVHFAVAAAGSKVRVNTVPYVRDVLGRGETAVAVTLAANGLGSPVAALALPRVLDRVRDRTVMLRAGLVLTTALMIGIPVTALLGAGRWSVLLVLWAVIGAGSAMVLTPAGDCSASPPHPPTCPPCSPPTSPSARVLADLLPTCRLARHPDRDGDRPHRARDAHHGGNDTRRRGVAGRGPRSRRTQPP